MTTFDKGYDKGFADGYADGMAANSDLFRDVVCLQSENFRLTRQLDEKNRQIDDLFAQLMQHLERSTR